MTISDDSFLTSKRPLRLAVVTETFPPEVNGVAHSIARICEGMLARGVQLQIVRPRQPGDEAPFHCPGAAHLLLAGASLPNYPAVRLGFPARGHLTRAWQAARPDVAHIVTEGPLGWSALRAAKRMGIAISSGFHTNFHGYAAHYGAGWFARIVMSYLRHFHNQTGVTIVPTAQMRDQLAVRGLCNLAVVGRGVNIELFNPSRRSEALRQGFGAGADDTVVLHVGRLAAEKNLAVLFDAFAAIRGHCPNARLVIVGDGPQRARLERDYPGHHFTGILKSEALAAHYASADLFLYPSLTETFGNVTLEAMASGLAVVAFDYAAAREHIRHMENGVLVPFGNAGSFVEMALMLARSRGRMRALREQARASAETLGWDRICDAFLEEVQGTLSAQSRIRLPDGRATTTAAA